VRVTPAARVATTCPYCGVGCGIVAERRDDGTIAISGDRAHPANAGRLCSKGVALADTLDLDGRLLYPEIGGMRVDWDQALTAVAEGFARVIAAHGPEAVAFYVSGQLLTEDYYVANKLMKGFIGSANIDTNSRLCMASAVAGHKRAFGADTVPGNYADLEQGDLIVLVGSNAAWCHPVLFQRIRRAKESRPECRVVVIDPRRTATCDIADLHLPLAPGTDAVLFNGLLNFLRREDALDFPFLEAHTEGFASALAAAHASAPSIPHVAQICGLPEAAVADFFRWFARTPRTVTLFSQGINQSATGTDEVNSIINCHLATGRIGHPGMGPFSLTGQPNAMGGREVGGLANQLAAHMDIDNSDDRARVRAFWRAPRMPEKPGLKAVDLFQAVERGSIKALWIMATNPAVSLPDAGRFARALRHCEFLVVSDCVRRTDTTAHAHVRLPALAWGEKDGTVTNSERRVSRQRSFLSPPGEAKPDWWIVTQVGRKLGFTEAFPYRHPADIFREHARLSGIDNDGARAFDIGALASVSDDEYERLSPMQWPVTAAAPNGTARLFADGHFFTPSGKARFVAVEPRPPSEAGDRFVINTGRVRDQWHTMTRTGKAARLATHSSEPFVEIHPRDAARMGVQDRALARIENACGEAIVRVQVSAAQRPGSIFMPIHWNGEFAKAAIASALVRPIVDPVSGQPALKHAMAHVAPYVAKWYGFALLRAQPDLGDLAYWVRHKGEHCWHYILADTQEPPDWPAWARAHLGAAGEWVEIQDRAQGRYRGARLREGRLEACLFIARTPELPSRTWLATLFASDGLSLSPIERSGLLSARALSGHVPAGPSVCTCFQLDAETLLGAARAQGIMTVDGLGEATGAGTNCGSCIPELRTLLARLGASAAA
jgi:assimilatory nitrate reductase catalytic subunit